MGELFLGWKLDTDKHPRYFRDGVGFPPEPPPEDITPEERKQWLAQSQDWLKGSESKPPNEKDHMVMVKSDDMAAHTAIIAQSGCGKSFFLGRLIEEIVLKTDGRCLILDPNADFRNIRGILGQDKWNPFYHSSKHEGKVWIEPYEETVRNWGSKTGPQDCGIYTGSPVKTAAGSTDEQNSGLHSFKVRWQDISSEFLSEDLDPIQKLDLSNCHDLYKAAAYLSEECGFANDPATLLRHTRSILIDDIPVAKMLFKTTVVDTNAVDIETLTIKARDLALQKYNEELQKTFGHVRNDLNENLKQAWDQLVKSREANWNQNELLCRTAAKYASKATSGKAVANYYLARASSYASMLAAESSVDARTKIRVLDLPSLRDRSSQLLAINYLLTREWEMARKEWSAAREPKAVDSRRAMFIIIDEAHNLIPAFPRSRAEEALREQFRTIVAEGRKYGLFLILVSQRPDKLDPLVVTECENRAVMKLSSGSVLESAVKALGLDAVRGDLLRGSLKYPKGRVLLVGKWTDRPREMCAAARRTVEGGSNPRGGWT